MNKANYTAYTQTHGNDVGPLTRGRNHRAEISVYQVQQIVSPYTYGVIIYMPSLRKIKLHPAQLSLSNVIVESQHCQLNSPGEVFHPTAVLAAVVAQAPRCAIGTRFHYVSSTVVPSTTESHLPNSAPKPLWPIWS